MLRLSALISICLLAFTAGPAAADRAQYLDLARRGWSYELRSTMVGRDMSIPVRISGQTMAGAALCIVGERPHPQTARLLSAFAALILRSFEKPLPLRYAGASGHQCGTGRSIILRLYSGHPPHRELSADLAWMNDAYDLGLPMGQGFLASYPAMAQTFFGRRGQGTHILVKQPRAAELPPLEADFYRSILIEELFQSFTFGMDILIFDREQKFLSKLQETPINLRRFRPSSPEFMRALVDSNPNGLCAFDVFMLHAVARAPVVQTIEPAFLVYIDDHFEELMARTREALLDPRIWPLMDAVCRDPT